MKKHGSNTTIGEQWLRAEKGTPLGGVGKIYQVHSSRFFSHLDQFHSLQRAQTLKLQGHPRSVTYTKSGSALVTERMEYEIGEGFIKRMELLMPEPINFNGALMLKEIFTPDSQK